MSSEHDRGNEQLFAGEPWARYRASGLIKRRGEIYMVDAVAALLICDASSWVQAFISMMREQRDTDRASGDTRFEEEDEAIAELEAWLSDPFSDASALGWHIPLYARQSVLRDVRVVVSPSDLDRLIVSVLSTAPAKIKIEPNDIGYERGGNDFATEDVSAIIRGVRAAVTAAKQTLGLQKLDFFLDDGRPADSDAPFVLDVVNLATPRVLATLHLAPEMKAQLHHPGRYIAAVPAVRGEADVIDAAARSYAMDMYFRSQMQL